MRGTKGKQASPSPVILSVWLIGALFAGQAQAQDGRRQPAVHVIAVRGECALNQPFAIVNGRMISTPGGGAADGASAEKPALLTRFVDDPPALQETVEELKQNRDLRLVDRIEDADLVFHVCSTYWEDVMSGGAHRRLDGANATRSYRIAARAMLLPRTVYEAKSEAYPLMMQRALWKADTLNDKEARAERDRREQRDRRVTKVEGSPGGVLIFSGHNWRHEVLIAELTDRFRRDSKNLLEQLSRSDGAASAAKPAAATGGDLRAGGATPVASARVDLADAVKIETSLVVVPVSVLDRDGKYIHGLKRENFEVYEDGVKQEISDFGSTETPFHVALLLDISGSTRFRVEEIQEAALAFLDQLRPQDQVMVVSFESAVRVVSEFTSNREQLILAIRRTRTGGATRVYDALDLVITERFSRIKGRKAIVVFSDGVDTASRLAEKDDVISRVEESGTLVYPIRYDTLPDVLDKVNPGGQKPHPRQQEVIDRLSESYAGAAAFLSDLARSSGGRYYDVDTIDDIHKAFDGIAEELRRQYWLGYYPTHDRPDNSYRKIRVRVDHPGAVVRSREGYRAQEAKR